IRVFHVTGVQTCALPISQLRAGYPRAALREVHEDRLARTRSALSGGRKMNRIRKGDHVVVTTGKDKGKRGDVVSVHGDKVVVSNVNLVKRHTKPNPQAGQPGGVVEREAPIHVSNVMLFNPATGKGDRIGIKVLEDGRKLRVFRSSGEALDA